MNLLQGATLALDPYCGAPPIPAELWSRWTLDPWLFAGLAAGLLVAWRLRRPGAGPAWALGGAFAVLAVAFVSPLCALSSALFSARVVHHMLMVAVAAPLLALALRPLRRRLSLTLTGGLFALALWLWHAPQPYGWALSHPALYWLMELSLLGSAVMFWIAALDRREPLPAALLALVATMTHMGLLGALITFARTPIYAPHLGGATVPWGLTALEDQQLAGLIMWAPAALPFLVAALVLAGLRLSRPLDRAEADR